MGILSREDTEALGMSQCPSANINLDEQRNRQSIVLAILFFFLLFFEHSHPFCFSMRML